MKSKVMRSMKLLLAMLLLSGMARAQGDDPVLMRVNGVPVTRSEFEYSFNKNNSDDVIDKKTVEEYVDLFVNYKLKVAAALDARIDTLESFRKEFAMYRDQQVRPSFVEDEDLDAEARQVYQARADRVGDRGLIRPSHIMVRLPQDATDEDLAAARERADSIYRAVIGGADFAELARRVSDDPGTARNGGDLNWIQPGQTIPDFENAAYALEVGQVSEPVQSPVGMHVILLKDRKQLEPYDSLKAEILDFLEMRGVRERIVERKLEEMVKASDGALTKDGILTARTAELSETDSDLRNLVREYHDGLLLYEISNQNVWDRAAKDEAGLEAYFEANRKDYGWDSPRYKGMVYHVRDKADVKAVRNCVKPLAFEQWAESLRTTFNADSVLRIRVEKGIFKEGDNAFIDKMVFKRKDATVTPVKDFPIDAVYGKVLKKGPESYQDVRGAVTADYQDALERQWVADLRERYPVEVDRDVLSTVNNHPGR